MNIIVNDHNSYFTCAVKANMYLHVQGGGIHISRLLRAEFHICFHD